MPFIETEPTVLPIRVASTDEWERHNTFLRRGEFGVEVTASGKVLVKCGISNTANSKWNYLPYINDLEKLNRVSDELSVIRQMIKTLQENGSGLIFSTKNEFPETGDPGCLYVDKDTNNIYRYDEITNSYNLISKDSTEQNIVKCKTYLEFPTVGDPNKFYIDSNTGKMYVYDMGSIMYKLVGNDADTIKYIDCGNSMSN